MRVWPGEIRTLIRRIEGIAFLPPADRSLDWPPAAAGRLEVACRVLSSRPEHVHLYAYT